jgi:hypothetical protein
MHIRTSHRILFTGLLILGLSLGSVHAADEASPFLHSERFLFRTGAFIATDIDTRIRLDGHLGAGSSEWDIGTDIDFPHTLKIDRRAQMFRAELAMNVKDRHRLDFAWFNLKVDGRTTLNLPIDFGDTDFASGLQINSFMQTETYRLAYSYTFARQPKWQAAALVGVHVMQIKAGISAPSVSLVERAGVTAPLPVVGLSFDYACTTNVLFRTRAQYLDISYNDYQGELLDLSAGLEWRWHPRWSVGGGVEYFDLDVQAEKDRIRLDADHRWLGYMAYLAYRF